MASTWSSAVTGPLGEGAGGRCSDSTRGRLAICWEANGNRRATTATAPFIECFQCASLYLRSFPHIIELSHHPYEVLNIAILISYPENPRSRMAGNEEQQFRDMGPKEEKEEDTWQFRNMSRFFLPVFSGLS